MLYELRELQRAMLEPLSGLAQAAARLYAPPAIPAELAPFSRPIWAGFELLHRLSRTYDKPAFGLTSTTIEGRAVPVVEQVVCARPFCNLVRFARSMPDELSGRPADPAVLVFAPLSGHFATLVRETIRALLPEHDVYVTDWSDARLVPASEGPFHLDDYVAYAIEFIRHLGPEVHLLAVCQPAVPVLAAVSILATLGDPRQPRSMILMGGPVDPRCNPTKVNQLATDKPLSWFEDNLVHRVPDGHPGAGRRVYPGFLQLTAFVAMNPERHLEAYRDYYLDLARGREDSAEAHRKFYDEYNAVLDMAADYYLETVRVVFQDFALPRGQWRVRFEGREHEVIPGDIDVPALFTVEGELDDITGRGQTEAAQALCSRIPASRRRHLVVEGAGHYGIFSGRRWREVVYPQVREFIRASR